MNALTNTLKLVSNIGNWARQTASKVATTVVDSTNQTLYGSPQTVSKEYLNSLAKEPASGFGQIQTYAHLSTHTYSQNPNDPLPKNWQVMKDASGKPVEIKDRFFGPGYEARAYLNPTTRQIVIASRGTETSGIITAAKDFGADAALGVFQVSALHMNTAFLFTEKVNKIAQKQYPNYETVQVGHSKGGYEAQLNGARYGQKVYAFDAPRANAEIDRIHANNPALANRVKQNITLIQGPNNLVNQSGKPVGNIIQVNESKFPLKVDTVSFREKPLNYLLQIPRNKAIDIISLKDSLFNLKHHSIHNFLNADYSKGRVLQNVSGKSDTALLKGRETLITNPNKDKPTLSAHPFSGNAKQKAEDIHSKAPHLLPFFTGVKKDIGPGISKPSSLLTNARLPVNSLLSRTPSLNIFGPKPSNGSFSSFTTPISSKPLTNYLGLRPLTNSIANKPASLPTKPSPFLNKPMTPITHPSTNKYGPISPITTQKPNFINQPIVRLPVNIQQIGHLQSPIPFKPTNSLSNFNTGAPYRFIPSQNILQSPTPNVTHKPIQQNFLQNPISPSHSSLYKSVPLQNFLQVPASSYSTIKQPISNFYTPAPFKPPTIQSFNYHSTPTFTQTQQVNSWVGSRLPVNNHGAMTPLLRVGGIPIVP